MDDLDLGATIKGFNPGQKIFGRYTLKRILGRGGMGVVWLARDGELDRDVALKFLPEIVALDPEALSDLKGETRRNLELTHPHIVRIYDFISDRTAAAISMEYVDGSTLAALKLDQPGRVFPVSELGPWIRQLCTALTYAHTEAQVVHRDLKPANLMIDARGDLKIADFGIAASVSDSVSRVSAQAGGSSGTPLYMSPQQMLGEKPCVADDIYSLGATLYELLTGKPPFYSGNVLLQVQSKRPPPIAERRQELAIAGEPVPREWEATIAACLSKEAKNRPASTEEVAERLGLAASAAGRKEQGAGSTIREKGAGRMEQGGKAALAPGGANRLDQPSGSLDSKIESPKSKMGPAVYAALAAGIMLLAGAGYYFGIYAPEQQRSAAEQARLAEIRRLEAQARTEADAKERARLEAEAVKLRTEQERVMAEAKAKAEQERLLAEHLAAARGGLVIRTTPSGAEVRVGAIAIDKSPLTLKDQKLGKYPVKVRADGYEDWAGEVEVKENEFTDLDVKLVRSVGTVVLTGPSGAEAFAGAKRLGTLPLTLTKVPTGNVSYTVRLNGYKTAEVSGEVERNAELGLNATLEQLPRPQPGQPYENTLGMKFVPIPGLDVLFSVWDTRVQDFQAFVQETGYDATAGMYSYKNGQWGQNGDSWKNPGYSQGPTHPVVGMSDADAKAFCAWLTKKEQAAGRLGPDQEYRLPTNDEWNIAAGSTEFPWGGQWPPPSGAGNYGDATAKRKYPNWGAIDGYDDGYAETSPVGSFAANRYGLYDMGGNVWQRVQENHLRGAAFVTSSRQEIGSKTSLVASVERSFSFSFRCVCVTGSGY